MQVTLLELWGGAAVRFQPYDIVPPVVITPTEASTVAWIKEIHAHQWDDAMGMPYYTHPVGAAEIFKRLYPEATEDEVMAVLLHDSKEDGGVSDLDLCVRGYSERTRWLVDMMTKETPKVLNYDERIEKIIATGDRALMFAKLSDNLHNRLRQMSGHLSMSDPPRYEKLIDKHTRSISRLCEALDIDPQEAVCAIAPETFFSEVPGFEFKLAP